MCKVALTYSELSCDWIKAHVYGVLEVRGVGNLRTLLILVFFSTWNMIVVRLQTITVGTKDTVYLLFHFLLITKVMVKCKMIFCKSEDHPVWPLAVSLSPFSCENMEVIL